MRMGAMQNIVKAGWVLGGLLGMLFAGNNDPPWCRASCRPIPAYPSVHLGTGLLRFNLIISSISDSIISISFNLIISSISISSISSISISINIR